MMSITTRGYTGYESPTKAMGALRFNDIQGRHAFIWQVDHLRSRTRARADMNPVVERAKGYGLILAM